MKLGFVTAILDALPFDEVLAFAGAEGFQCVEVMCWPEGGPDRRYGGVRHIGVEDFSKGKADDVGALCAKHGISISGLGYYANPLSASAEEAVHALTHIRKVIDAARLLGVEIFNTFVGANTKLPLDENMQRFADIWPDLVRYAEDRGVKIGIENCPMLFPNTWPFGMNLARTPAIWRRMFEVVPSPNFGLNYDPSHMVMQLMDPVKPIHEFGPRIFHTHAKDMRADRDSLDDMGTLVPPMQRCLAKIPGFGDVHWGQWIGALTDIGFEGAVCIEIEDEAFTDTLEGRKRALRISRNVLQPLIA
ncbi:MAG: sugar phosphate isomerase/epimerase [Pirellulales bacterium]